MPITETIKKGKIKRKVSDSAVDVLHPVTDADIVNYVNTTSGLTAGTVQAAIDEVSAAIAQAGKVDDVKIQVDSGTPTSILSNKIATIPVTSSYSGTSETIVNGKAIKAAIDGLDVSEFKLTATNTSTNVVTLHGIKETDGKIAVGTTASNDVTFYNKTGADNAISAAINALDTQSNVAPAAVSGSGSAQKITFKDISETNGIIAAGSNITNAVTYTDTAIDSLLGNKLDKRTSNNEVYTHSGSTQGGIAYDTAATASAIVQRDSNGQIIVPDTPTANGHAASKKYVDTKITSGAEYLGVVDDTTELYALDSSAGEGDWVRVGTQFTYNSETCHVGDILICSAEKGTSTHATWDVLHTEVDTDTNTTYEAIVGTSGTGYAGSIILAYKNIGDSGWTNQDTIKFINGTGISITPDILNKTIKINHSNSITAQTTAKVFKTKLDGQGHVTEATAATASDVGVTISNTTGSEKITVDGTSLQLVTRATAQTITGNKTFGDLSNSATINLVNESKIQGYSLNGISPYYGFELSKYGYKYTYTNNGTTSETTYKHDKIVRSLDGGTTEFDINLPTSAGTLALMTDIPSVDTFVSGPSSATNNAIAIYDGTTGKLIKNTSVTITTASSVNTLNLGASGKISNGTNSVTIANIATGLTTDVKSGKKADGTTDISATKSGTVFTLGDSGVTAGTYSAVQVNAKGIAVAGGQILSVIANGGTPGVVNGGWYFEENAA